MKRKALILVASSVLALGGGGARALEGEVIRNGGFEARGGGNTPWAGWRTGLWDGGQYDFEAAAGRGSPTCALIRCRKQGRGGIGQVEEVALDPGARYFFSVWVKAENAAGGTVFANLYSSRGGWGQVHLPGGTHDWQRVVKVVTAPPHGGLQLYIHNKTQGDVYLDDVSLRKLAPGEEPPSAVRKPVVDYRHLPEGKDYALGVSSTMEKVFRDEAYPHRPAESASLALARGEGEGLQLVVIHPRKKLIGVRVSARVESGVSGAQPPELTVSPMNYVRVRENTRFYLERPGWYPVVLLPNGPVDVEKDQCQPFWIDVVAGEKTAPGIYNFGVTVKPSNAPAQTMPLAVKVRSFAIPQRPSIRTITWVPMSGPKRLGGSPRDYHAMAQAHRLSPGGELGPGFYWGPYNLLRNWGPGGGYKFDKLGELHPDLEFCLERGMNTFIMATTPNLHRAQKDAYDPEMLAQLGPFVRSYQKHLDAKGWGRYGVVYGYDECPRKHWDEHKKAYAALKRHAPDAKMILCLNDPEGVAALAGHVDIWLLYIPFHVKSRVDELKKPGEEVWWSYGCMYPADRPNQFIPYPGIDLRITPWIAWRHGITGLSNWGLTYWHASNVDARRTFPCGDWAPNTEVPGDGSLIYPGAGGGPLASARLKNTRDGLEDYEYIVLAEALAKRGDARAKAALDEIRAMITAPTVYAQDPAKLLEVRERLAEAIEAHRAPPGR